MKTSLGGSPLRRMLVVAVAAATLVLVAACAPAPTPPPSTPVPVALAPIEVIAVGDVRQGALSDQELVIRVTELESDSLPGGPGAFQLTVTDTTGSANAVSFTGTPTVTAPGSLGATAIVTRSNVLTIQVVDTDTINVESMTIEGFRLRASATAPLGALTLTIDACSGSLAGCAANNVLPSPGTLVAAP